MFRKELRDLTSKALILMTANISLGLYPMGQPEPPYTLWQGLLMLGATLLGTSFLLLLAGILRPHETLLPSDFPGVAILIIIAVISLTLGFFMRARERKR